MKKGTPARNPWGEDIRKYYGPGGTDEEEPKGNHYWKKRKKAEEERKRRKEQGERKPWHGFDDTRLRQEIYNENAEAIKEYERTGKTQRARCISCLGSGKGETQIVFGTPGTRTPKCKNCDGSGVVPIPPGSVSRPHEWPQYKNTVEETR